MRAAHKGSGLLTLSQFPQVLTRRFGSPRKIGWWIGGFSVAVDLRVDLSPSLSTAVGQQPNFAK